jgi:hypothetical protein
MTEIKLTEIRSVTSLPGQGLSRIVLGLSGTPPGGWGDMFRANWKGHLYSMKRTAAVHGASIQIDAPPSELEHDHLPELKAVVAETNAQWQAHLVRVKAEENEQNRVKDKDAATLAELKNKLKFDN